MKLLEGPLLGKKNNSLFLVMLSFVFVASSAMAINSDIASGKKQKIPVVVSEKVFPQNPVLGASTSYPILSAEGVFAVDLGSGVPLYEKNVDVKLLPASTTKIVTALVALDTYKLDQIITVPDGVVVDGQKMGIYKGEQMTFENLLKGLLVYSANDAAEALARSYPGGYDVFISEMNKKAEVLGMVGSHFENPVGLDNPLQYTTARDLVRASEVAMRNPVFSGIVGTENVILTDVTGKTVYNLKNINQLLGAIPGVVGIKTGWTENARENLVTEVNRDGHKVIIAVLGSQDRFGETKELIDWIFSNYNWQEVKTSVIGRSNPS